MGNYIVSKSLTSLWTGHNSSLGGLKDVGYRNCIMTVPQINGTEGKTNTIE